MRSDESAAKAVAAAPLSETRQLVSFALGSEEYGVDIASVQEINRMVEITRVPQTATYMEGIINLRGQLIPVIDLRTRLHLARTERTRDSRIIVVEVAGTRIGMIVDSVSEVVRIPLANIESPPDMISSVNPHFIGGVGKNRPTPDHLTEC